MRGASSSFGIATSIQVETFAVPDSATMFSYFWDLSAADAAHATQQFQNFVQTDIPQEFGAYLVVERGSSSGMVHFGLTGGWYAPADQFAPPSLILYLHLRSRRLLRGRTSRVRNI